MQATMGEERKPAEEAAAVKIQANVRGMAARKHVQRMRAEAQVSCILLGGARAAYTCLQLPGLENIAHAGPTMWRHVLKQWPIDEVCVRHHYILR
jgi:hypothetical protein